MSWLDPAAAYILGAEGYVFVVAAVFLRISAVAFLAPGLGERAVPPRVRLAAAAGLAVVVTPLVMSSATMPQTAPDLTAILAAEAVAGLILGFALRIFVFVLQVVGAIAAQSLSLSQLLGSPLGLEAESPYTAILVVGGVALALSAGLHFHIAVALAESYRLFPLGAFPGAGASAQWSVAETAEALRIALALAAPFMLLGFIYSLALAAASRAMPQLMAAFVGAPAITFAGLVLFAAAAPILLWRWLDLFGKALGSLFGLAS